VFKFGGRASVESLFVNECPEILCRCLSTTRWKRLTAHATLPFEDLTCVASPQCSGAVSEGSVSVDCRSEQLLYELWPYHNANSPSKLFDRLARGVVGRPQAKLASTADMSAFGVVIPAIFDICCWKDTRSTVGGR